MTMTDALPTLRDSVPLRDYFEAIIQEQRRGLVVAEQEREKAAAALRGELERSIAEGDRNLRDHVSVQVGQISRALDSAERLEVQRVQEIEAHVQSVEAAAILSATSATTAGIARIDSLRREVLQAADASQQAIDKAERASEKRFESVNEFRAQLADQSGSFLPREVADAQFSELRKLITNLTDRANIVAGTEQGSDRRGKAVQGQVQLVIGALGVMVAILSIVVVVILANA